MYRQEQPRGVYIRKMRAGECLGHRTGAERRLRTGLSEGRLGVVYLLDPEPHIVEFPLYQIRGLAQQG
jgi:hypothetical protein